MYQRCFFRKKGAVQINISQKLSDKYEELDTIYESAASQVVLVRHKGLNQMRIIKRVAKENSQDSLSNQEANILLNLRHPNIPILYDLEEDQEYIYIVEEYIVGESMADYLYLHQSISHSRLVEIAITLYDILDYLHTMEPIPIIYQDMKLEHIYVSNGRIVLIDYGIATYLRDNASSTYGTLSYVSKSQLQGKCQLINDIYNTKIALKRIYNSSNEGREFSIEKLLRIYKQEEKEKDAAYYRSKWQELLKLRNKVKKHLDVKIGVVGNDTGIGVTHIAISLCCYLNNVGIHSYYKDCNVENNVLETILSQDRSFYEEDNIIYHDCFRAIRSSGEAIRQIIPPIGLYVWDLGTNIKEAEECDYIIYVQSSRSYKSELIEDIAYNKETATIINPGKIGWGISLARATGNKVYSFPLDMDPFAITRKKSKVLEKLMRGWIGVHS